MRYVCFSFFFFLFSGEGGMDEWIISFGYFGY